VRHVEGIVIQPGLDPRARVGGELRERVAVGGEADPRDLVLARVETGRLEIDNDLLGGVPSPLGA
jgi:hypothetical protein